MSHQEAVGRLVACLRRLRDPRRGCSWDLQQSFATIVPYTIEEAYEVADAIDRGDMAALEDELGDLLFAVVNLARHLNVDPEEALRQANRKFEKRFRAIEKAPGFEAMSLDEMEALWKAAKADQAD